ncbi:MAG: response regulator [Deltaproteobacteria bacterium]|nr:response regulator [Deltaproteobacteria bacterium]
MIDVLVVEDDPMVAHINQEYLARFPNVKVAAWLASGLAALNWLATRPADLIVLEVFLPDINGLELLRQIRRRDYKVDAIVATAANEASLIEELLRLGVEDYLIKPFAESRFVGAMRQYLAKKETLKSGGELSQDGLDRLLRGATEVPLVAKLPKGLQSSTWNLVLATLAKCRERHLGCEDLAAKVELSKVTVRRYLKCMVETRLVEGIVDYETGGRPATRYRLLAKGLSLNP